MSQSDLRLHFGLGKHERLDRAEIRWPDGATEVITNLAADKFYTVARRRGSDVEHRTGALGKATLTLLHSRPG